MTSQCRHLCYHHVMMTSQCRHLCYHHVIMTSQCRHLCYHHVMMTSQCRHLCYHHVMMTSPLTMIFSPKFYHQAICKSDHVIASLTCAITATNDVISLMTSSFTISLITSSLL